MADPASPAPGPLVATLKLGVFCALQAMDQRPAPGTLSGWIHVPDGMIDFHWPDRQVVPAAIGLAFGVKSQMRPGVFLQGEMRVYRPGSTTPETWDSSFSDTGEQFGFFRFDLALRKTTTTSTDVAVGDDRAAVLFRPDAGPPCVVLDIDEFDIATTRQTRRC